MAEGGPETSSCAVSTAQVSSAAEAYVEDTYGHGTRQWACLLHARRVGELLRDVHCSDDVVAAGILQDAVQDTAPSVDEIRERFGERVAELIGHLTEDPHILDYRARQRALRDAVRAGGPATLLIFAADTLARMRRLDENELAIAPLTLEHYRHGVAMLASSGIRSSHVVELRARVERRHEAAREAAARRPVARRATQRPVRR